MVCAELLIRRDAAVVFKGLFDLLKQSSITNYLSRNPNNIPLFLYEKFFYVLFGSSGLWVMQALNILYVNLGAVLLYKLSQKHFNQNGWSGLSLLCELDLLLALFLFHVYGHSASFLWSLFSYGGPWIY